MMQYLIGFLVGIAVAASVAHVYIQKVVNEEILAARAKLTSLKATVDAKVAEVRTTVADKVAGK